MLDAVRVAVVQYGVNDIVSAKEFWKKSAAIINEAEEKGCKLVVFPEYLTIHLLALAKPMQHSNACIYLHGYTDEYTTRFYELAKKTAVTILAGTHIVEKNGLYYNTAFLFTPSGMIHKQSKIHLTPEERNMWKLASGQNLDIFITDFGSVAVLICYDIEFPEVARIVADKGVEIILCPSYTDTKAGYNRVRFCSHARAIENQLYVVLSGITYGLPRVPQVDTAYCQAGIFAPCDYPFPSDGILTMGQANRDEILVYDLDFTLLRENREKGQVKPFFDRKINTHMPEKTRTNG
ncbi:MAG: carbon-nitrogen hydrolase family protein [Bacillota bacterium]